MEIVRLRIMTMKSILGWGSYENRTVESMIRDNSEYLIYVYYHHQNHSFTEEVLDAIGIAPEFRINKPGIRPELFLACMSAKDEKRVESISDEAERERQRKLIRELNEERAVRYCRRKSFRENMADYFANEPWRMKWKREAHL